MRIFLMMVPVIMNDNVKIFDSFAGNITGGYVIRLVFILGGMFAVYKSSTLLTGIISSSVAAEENMNNALLGGMVAGGMMKGAKAMAGAGISAFSKMRSKSKETVSESKGKSSKFTGGTSNTAGKGKFPQSNKPRQKNYLSDKEYDDTLASVDELFRTGTLGTDYQAEKDYEDTLSSVDELFRTGTLGTDYQAEKDYEDTLSSVDELFKTGTLGSAYQDEENAYEGVRNLFGEEGGDSFNDGSSTDYSAQDIVKNVDPLEAAKNTTGGSSSGSAQFTGDSAATVVKTVDPLEAAKNTTSGSSGGTSSSSGGSAQFTGDSAGSSASSRSAESKQSSNLDDPLLHRKNDHKNDSGKF